MTGDFSKSDYFQHGTLQDFSGYLEDNKKQKESSVIWSSESILRSVLTGDFTSRGAFFLVNPNRKNEGETIHDISVTVQVIKPGDSTTPHSHSFWHLYIGISGSGKLVLNENESSTITVGDIIYVPAWGEHQFINNGQQDLVLYVIQNLPGMARQGTLLRKDGIETYSTHTS